MDNDNYRSRCKVSSTKVDLLSSTASTDGQAASVLQDLGPETLNDKFGNTVYIYIYIYIYIHIYIYIYIM